VAIATSDHALRHTSYAAIGLDSRVAFQSVTAREQSAAEVACVIRYLRDTAEQSFVGVDDPRSPTARIWAIFYGRLGDLRASDRDAGSDLIDLCSDRQEFRAAWSAATECEFPVVD